MEESNIRVARMYLPPEGRALPEGGPKTFESPEPGTGYVLVYPPHRTGEWRAIWQVIDSDRHESTESYVFAEIMRWAFTGTDEVYLVELHSSVVGGPRYTRLAPLPGGDAQRGGTLARELA